MIRQRGVAARAVHRRAVGLIQEPTVEEILQNPPAGLDVVVLVRDVRVVEIEPEADPLGQLVPVTDIAEHRFPTLPVELGDPALFDVLLALRPDLLLDLHLDRETVRVPPRPAQNAVTAHGAVTGVQVFERAGSDVVDPGLAVGGGGAFEEDVRR
jgi:hypothetical protein